MDRFTLACIWFGAFFGDIEYIPIIVGAYLVDEWLAYEEDEGRVWVFYLGLVFLFLGFEALRAKDNSQCPGIILGAGILCCIFGSALIVSTIWVKIRAKPASS